MRRKNLYRLLSIATAASMLAGSITPAQAESVETELSALTEEFVGSNAENSVPEDANDSAQSGGSETAADRAQGSESETAADRAQGSESETAGDSAQGSESETAGDSTQGGEPEMAGDSAQGGEPETAGDSTQGGESETAGDSAQGGESETAGDSAQGSRTENDESSLEDGTSESEKETEKDKKHEADQKDKDLQKQTILSVNTEKGEACALVPVEVPAELTSGGVTHPFDSADGVYQIQVPDDTQVLQVTVDGLSGIPKDAKAQEYAFFAGWGGYLLEQSGKWQLYPEFLNGDTVAYGALDHRKIQEISYANETYTLPLESFLIDPESLTLEQQAVYGELGTDAAWAEISVGIFDREDARELKQLLLVQIGGAEEEARSGESADVEPQTNKSAEESETEELTDAEESESAESESERAADLAVSCGLGLERKLDGTEQQVYASTGQELADLAKEYTPVVGSISGEWQILGLARSEQLVDASVYSNYKANVINTVLDNNGILHAKKYTEYSRVVLALTAIGEDVTNVGGYNLLEPLADFDQTVWQGVNGAIFALLAFDSHSYEIPKAPSGKKQTSRENLIEHILKQEVSGGGWALSGSSADADMTAMAIQGLAPYYSSNAQVKTAVDRGLAKLSAMQNASGGFGSWGTDNSESCAQVIVALSAIGIDLKTDSRFIKNGKTVMDALISFQAEEGGFKHVANSGRNQMATEQAYYALTAYDRFKNGKKSLYDMNDVPIKSDYEKVAEVEAMLDTLPSAASLEQKETIRTVLAIYNGLSSVQKPLIAEEKVQKLLKLAADLDQLEIANVEQLISGIGTVTLAKENQIKAANAAYNALSEVQKKKISNYNTLKKALTDLDQLKYSGGSGEGNGSGSKETEKQPEKKPGGTTTSVNMPSSKKPGGSGGLKVPAGGTAGTSVGGKKTGSEEESEKESESETGNGIIAGATKAEELSKKQADTLAKKIARLYLFGKDPLPEGEDAYTDRQVNEVISLYQEYLKLSAEAKTMVEKDASYQKLMTSLARLGEKNHVDASTGVDMAENEEEALPWHIQMVASPQLMGENQKELIKKTLGEDSEVRSLNDIRFVDLLSGDEWHPEELVRVKLPRVDLAEGQTPVIVHMKDDGSIEFLEAKISGNYLEFQAAEFSAYGIVGFSGSMEDLLAPEAPQTDVQLYVLIGGGAAALVILLMLLRMILSVRTKRVKTRK